MVVTSLSTRDYGTLAFWAPPNWINYCGRRYLRTQHAVLSGAAEPRRWDRRMWIRLALAVTPFVIFAVLGIVFGH